VAKIAGCGVGITSSLSLKIVILLATPSDCCQGFPQCKVSYS
jgi:hypothetical protein